MISFGDVVLSQLCGMAASFKPKSRKSARGVVARDTLQA
jgi:hypothetical protein